jgi:hypothetical protein
MKVHISEFIEQIVNLYFRLTTNKVRLLFFTFVVL